ncbi:alpha/beta fold hydrolase [Pseudomonas sp. 5P_3.1_Bac2]|uniref:alpha/beta fold hydrolase n=1 Tax=Pseudomonas sp. 5P_3.1_Bac2 TaxID=2971617 RepID=UPI0021C69662|nr:alpha/beta fold hydrolase [Pseudomonas sp. 5P_3.1_Bac2]MCU1717773.1 transporter [Pseudomonas sp. 5P_3.1_Bac2]
MTKLVVLPGWGLATAPLQPLAAALLARGIEVQVAALPLVAEHSLEGYLGALDQQLPDDVWLAGWSLGGMLATALAARRGARCAGLISLASNLRFVASQDWPSAMPASTFAAFVEGCAADPGATLKRFALLCAQGAANARQLSRELLANVAATSAPELLAGLELLAALDNREALASFSGAQLHLLAGADGLVPAAAWAAIQHLAAQAPGQTQVELIESLSHALCLEQPQLIAQRMAQFIDEVGHD